MGCVGDADVEINRVFWKLWKASAGGSVHSSSSSFPTIKTFNKFHSDE